MKKYLIPLFALTLAGTLYAGGGCGSCTGKSEKKADKAEGEVVVEGTESKECDSSTKECTGKTAEGA